MQPERCRLNDREIVGWAEQQNKTLNININIIYRLTLCFWNDHILAGRLRPVKLTSFLNIRGHIGANLWLLCFTPTCCSFKLWRGYNSYGDRVAVDCPSTQLWSYPASSGGGRRSSLSVLSCSESRRHLRCKNSHGGFVEPGPAAGSPPSRPAGLPSSRQLETLCGEPCWLLQY